MTNPIRVYLANGGPQISRCLGELLEPFGYQVLDLPLTGGGEAWRGEEEHGVILFRWPSSSREGFGSLRQTAERYPCWPILSVADAQQAESVARTVGRGASDFLIQPLTVNVLEARIRKAIEDAELRRLATTDGLTQLCNLRSFSLRLREEMARASRYARQLSLIMLDIDRFKGYNDTHGHQRANQALQQIARVLRQFTRSSDTIARYGGDEFVVLLPETEEEQALRVADRLRSVVEKHPFGGEGVPPDPGLTISLGVGCHRMGESPDVLLRRVDEALYQAKREGRNRVAQAG